MFAKLIDTMGNDLKVVNAARVSFAKQHAEFQADKDAGLIRYLAKHNHWTPFGHCQATFHVKAPIFVARQLVKHQVGLVWNEISRRYVDDTPEFYWPADDAWRLRAENKKQGSSDECLTGKPLGDVLDAAHDAVNEATRSYKILLDNGVAPEMARMLLPLNAYTEWHWTGSLAAWARVCKLRLDPHAQKECRDVAQEIDSAMAVAFPVSWAALMGGGE